MTHFAAASPTDSASWLLRGPALTTGRRSCAIQGPARPRRGLRMSSRDAQPGLARRLSMTDAVVLGLGSMIGAGVFAVFGPAARGGGAGRLLGLLLAAGVAYCNAVASAQLAAAYPMSGGTYYYGRERLGPWCGFTAGWGFVAGK